MTGLGGGKEWERWHVEGVIPSFVYVEVGSAYFHDFAICLHKNIIDKVSI
jgi:hypothetical protein